MKQFKMSDTDFIFIDSFLAPIAPLIRITICWNIEFSLIEYENLKPR